MPKSAEAVIVGGGVIGLSTAYHLAKKKFGRVIVLDKGPVGDGSSSRAAGIITGLLWTETGVRARKKSLELFRELSHELRGYQFREAGALNLFDGQSWPQREELLPLYERLRAPYEILDSAEIRRRWPALDPREDFIGLFDPLGGYSEPEEYLPALASKCRELGVQILEHSKVEGFSVQNGRVTGVRTGDAVLEAPAVICTVYAWTLPLMKSLGERLPVKSFVHQRYVTTPLSAPLEIPVVNANPLNGYIRPAAGSRLLAGIESSERAEFPVPSTDFHMSSLTVAGELKVILKREFTKLVPALENLSWATEHVGLLTFSLDGEPILGPVDKLPGLYVAVAFHSGGFGYNPVAGLMLAELVADGHTSIEVSAFSPNRFRAGEVDEFLATTIPQKWVTLRRH